MLKKIVHIVIVSALLLSTSGIAVFEHHCMGGYEFTGLWQASGCCCNTDMEMPANCCEDETYWFQLDTDFQSKIFSTLQPVIAFAAYPQSPYEASVEHNLPFFSSYFNYHPPLLIGDIQSQFQVFLN